jgi:RimJ/RimL family protein N-acetyltransferase
MTDQTAAFDRVTWPRRTERLTLRPATAADLEATWSFRRLDDVSRWLTRAPRTIDDYRSQFDDPASLAKTIIIERDGAVIGDLMLAVGDAWSQAEVSERARQVQADLGWALHPDYRGAGYATEAVVEMLNICFDDLGLRRVTANCFADNDASWRLMERVGMRREGHAVRESLHRAGEWLDAFAYALLADEYQLHRKSHG